MGQKRQRSRPTKLRLLAVYLISFFCTSLWLTSLQDTQPRRRRGRGGFFSQHTNILLGKGGKRPRRITTPDDFVGLKILAYGDSPYQFGPWDVSPIVVASHKLLFWTTPKVACTEFKKLFRRMQGYTDWMDQNFRVPHRPASNGLNYLYDFRPSEADAMLTDPSWTRAIFVRDPKERLLSAYLDKVMSNYSSYVRRHCCGIPSINSLLHCPAFRLSDTIEKLEQLPNPAVSFSQFLQNVYGKCADPHWAPQAKRIPEKYWPCINFVGHLEPNRIQQDSERLLRKIGAWEKFGASGWPSGAFFADNSAKHATFAKHQMQTYYTPELEAVVEEILEPDYNHPLFNLSVSRLAQ